MLSTGKFSQECSGHSGLVACPGIVRESTAKALIYVLGRVPECKNVRGAMKRTFEHERPTAQRRNELTQSPLLWGQSEIEGRRVCRQEIKDGPLPYTK